MLAGEPFSDQPASVCPVIGSFLRAYNDSIDDGRRQDAEQEPLVFAMEPVDGEVRVDARKQLGRVKRFRDVIHRAEFEPAQFVGGAVPRSQHDDGDGFRLWKLLELTEQIEAIYAGQPEVEENEIRIS